MSDFVCFYWAHSPLLAWVALPFLNTFCIIFQNAFFYNPGLQNGDPGCPEGAPKTPKSSQNDLQRRASKKRMEKVAKKCIFQKAGYAIRSRLCSPNTLFCVRASAGKMIKKASQKLLKIVQKSSKNACRAYQEFMQKKLRRKTQKMPKSVKNGPQNGWFFRGGEAPKSQKIRGAFKMGPPGLQNHSKS